MVLATPASFNGSRYNQYNEQLSLTRNRIKTSLDCTTLLITFDKSLHLEVVSFTLSMCILLYSSPRLKIYQFRLCYLMYSSEHK